MPGDLLDRPQEPVDVLARRAEPEAGAHRAGHARPPSALQVLPNLLRVVVAHPEQAEHERMGAETAVANADPVLGAEDRGEVRMMVAVEVERDHADARMLLAPQRVEGKPRNLSEASPCPSEQLVLTGRQSSHAGFPERGAGDAEGHGTDDVG